MVINDYAKTASLYKYKHKMCKLVCGGAHKITHLRCFPPQVPWYNHVTFELCLLKIPSFEINSFYIQKIRFCFIIILENTKAFQKIYHIV